MPKKVRVLIVDDSAYMRVVLTDILESEGAVEVLGSAKDGLEAVEKSKALKPDVVILDIQMPKMDGLATLQRIMKEAPSRVIMLSAMDKFDDQLPLKALEMGAVDFISKPSGPVSIEIINFKERIVEVITQVASTSVEVLRQARRPLPEKLRLERPLSTRSPKAVVIGSSTGGLRALEVIFAQLPKEVTGSFFMVQHLPPEFSESFAKRLDLARGPRVVLAVDEQRVEKGMAYLAPGGRHLRLRWKGATTLMTKLDDDGPVNFVRPSADVLFTSAAECLGTKVLAVVLTGMGIDGREGARAVKQAGGKVLVQNERTSVAHSMPRAIIEAGLADDVLPIEEIPERIIEFLQEE